MASASDYTSYYTVAHPDEFAINWRSFYERAALWTAEVRSELTHQLDLPYGQDPKQQLDVYGTCENGSAAPVFVFLHGGGFREGDRAQYGYVARQLAKHGIVTVVASYRLTATAHFPAQLDDVKSLLTWVHRHIADHGGDAGFVCLGGHSAGAILSASACADTAWLAERALPADLVKAFVPISGVYDLTLRDDLANYAPDAVSRRDASPLLRLEQPVSRAIVVAGEAEERYLGPSRMFAEKLQKAGVDAEFLELDGMTHDQTVAALADRNLLTESILGLFPAPAE